MTPTTSLHGVRPTNDQQLAMKAMLKSLLGENDFDRLCAGIEVGGIKEDVLQLFVVAAKCAADIEFRHSDDFAVAAEYAFGRPIRMVNIVAAEEPRATKTLIVTGGGRNGYANGQVYLETGPEISAGNQARIKRRRPTVVMRQPKWMVIAAVFAAVGVAVGFVAGTAAVDASPVASSAIRSTVPSSTVVAKSRTYVTPFPEPNRAAKGNLLSVRIPDDQVGAAIGQAINSRDSRSVQSRTPGEGKRKPMAHCEPVGSSLAGPAILYMPSRSCLAGLRAVPRIPVV